MAVVLPDLPKFLVLDPLSTVRVELRLRGPACEIDVELDNPRPGRSFVVLIGHKDGPFVQRVRLAGKAKIYFDPQSPGDYVLLVANPQKELIVLRLRARDVGLIETHRHRPHHRASAQHKPAGARTRGPRTAARPAPRAGSRGDRAGVVRKKARED